MVGLPKVLLLVSEFYGVEFVLANSIDRAYCSLILISLNTYSTSLPVLVNLVRE